MSIFVKKITKFPKDNDLRRFKKEKTNWLDFRINYVRERIPTPKQISVDRKDMKNIKFS